MTNENGRPPLPEGWVWTSLGEVISIRNGYAFKSKDYCDSGILLIRQTNLSGVKVDTSHLVYLPSDYAQIFDRYIVKKGKILIGLSGSIGKLSVYDLDEIALQNQRTGLIEFKDSTSHTYVRYFLETLEKDLQREAKGVAVQNISSKQIESVQFP